MNTADHRPVEDSFRLLVESIVDLAVYMLDPEGRVTTWNPGAERIKEYAAPEILGRHFRIFYPPEDAEAGQPERELSLAREHGRHEAEGWRVRKDGSRYWANVVLAAVRNGSGRLLGFANVTRDLTRRKEAEERLRQSEERFRLLVERGHDYAITMLDAQGNIASWNAGAERMIGYKEDEAVGKPFSIFYPREAADGDEPRHVLNVAAAEGRHEVRGWRLRKDGSRFWADTALSALRNEAGLLEGFTVAIRDATRKKAEEERFRIVVEGAPNAMVMINHEGRIILVNAQAERMFGYPREELVGLLVEILVPERFRARHPGYRASFLGDPKARPMGAGRDLFGLKKDGTEIPVEIGLNPMKTEEGEFVLAAIVDITERKRAQNEILRLNAELEDRVARRTAQLQETVQELETFTYSVAHDLRAPLRAMHRSAEVLLQDEAPKLSEDGRDFLRRIAEGAHRMDTLIRDLLAYSRVTRSELKLVPVEPADVLSEVLEQMSSEIRERRAEVRIEPPLRRLRADPVLLGQVFHNLIGNALKFVATGTLPRVRIGGEGSDGTERIRIEDNGIGIDPRFRDRLFRMFERLHTAYPGTGIGLAIVKRAVERMGGRSGFEPGENGGTRFWIELPLA